MQRLRSYSGQQQVGAVVNSLRRIFNRKDEPSKRPFGVEQGDILDLEAFGGTWEAALQSVVPDYPARSSLIDYIGTGRLPASIVPSPDRHRSPQEMLFWQSHSGASQLLREQPRVVLAILLALPEGRRSSFLVLAARSNLRGITTFRGILLGLLGTSGNAVSIRDLEQAGPVLGWKPNEILDSLVSTNQTGAHPVTRLSTLTGFDEFVGRDIEPIRDALTPARNDHAPIWGGLQNLKPEVLNLLAPQVCDAATANSKSLRKAAAPALLRLSVQASSEQLKRLALSAKPDQRSRAILTLADISDNEQREGLRQWANENLANDRSVAVQEAWLELNTQAEPMVQRPALPPVDFPTLYERNFKPVDGPKAAGANLLSILNREALPPNTWFGLDKFLASARGELLSQLGTSHCCRLLLNSPWLFMFSSGPIATDLSRTGSLSPLDVTAVAVHDEFEVDQLFHLVSALHAADPALWSADQITDWILYHEIDLIEFLETRSPFHYLERASIFGVIEASNSIPGRLRKALVGAAVDGFKSDKADLYRIIESDHVDEILPYLLSRKRTERLGAAEWLRAHLVPSAAGPLYLAARKETDDRVKAAILAVLEALGESIEEFLGAETLLADANKALAKKPAVPKSISWLNLDSLPVVSWADGKPVATEIIQWFLISAVRNKTAEPSPILRRHFDSMDQEQVRALGASILDLWMAEDVRCFSEAEAAAEAQRTGVMHFRWAQNGQGPNANKTLQQITDELHSTYREQMFGSATTSKGLLAVVAASAGPEVADRTMAYIQKHRGHRVSQAKILLQMLAWIDEPATVQVVMSVSTRFRPKGIQNEALKQAELLAARHGWTMNDLADRSVPRGGFDNSARQVINYGDRNFTAHLGDDLAIVLMNEDSGKTIRALPRGRVDEDADLIKDLKKDFAAAKKELKTATKLQPARLHLAMCVQRSWSLDDFTRYFLQHPVMARLATRLVWSSLSDGGDTVLFRPLTDGTLLGIDDNDVLLEGGAVISIAHEQLTGIEAGSTWQSHLSDYEIEPLFGQFARPGFEPEQGQTVIRDFVGFMHNDGSLRGQMNRYGWQLGGPQDGGVVFELLKDASDAGLTVVIEVLAGIPAAAHDVGSWTCAVGEMYFIRQRLRYVDPSMAIELGKVPAILLSELYAEVQAMAQAGSGFDPDYKEKV